MSKVTIKMIAERAGTSIGTVDRALSNRPGINKDTKERILKIAKEMEYSPNQLASALSRKRVIRIAMVYPATPRHFFGYVQQGILKAQSELDGFGIQVDSICSVTENSVEQEELLKSTDFSQYNGIAISVCGNEISRYIDDFTDSGIPVVTFNSDAPQSKRLFYVGHDSRKSGRLGGELMGKMLGGFGKVIVLGNFTAAPTFIERYGGFCEVIQSEYPGISIYPCAECRRDYRIASRTIANMFKEMSDIKGIFLTGATSTIGAVDAVRRNKIDGVTVVGYDLTGQIREALHSGICSAILCQDPFEQGRQAVHMLARHLLEGWSVQQSQLLINMRVLFKYNVDDVENMDIPDDYSEENYSELRGGG